MHEILHVIGLCSDSVMHIDLIDIFIANYENLIHIRPKQFLKKIRSYNENETYRRFSFIRTRRD